MLAKGAVEPNGQQNDDDGNGGPHQSVDTLPALFVHGISRRKWMDKHVKCYTSKPADKADQEAGSGNGRKDGGHDQLRPVVSAAYQYHRNRRESKQDCVDER